MSQTNCDNVSTKKNTKKLQTFLKLGLIERKIPIECDTFNGIPIALEISYKMITTLFGQ
jgi:hypothetical protein